MSYRISTVSELTGIPRNTLIAWERRYKFMSPARHENGYRSYTDEDVAKLLRIKNAIGAGLKISEAIAIVKRSEEGVLPTSPQNTEGTQQPFFIAIKNQLITALIQYRAKDAERLFGQLVGASFEDRLHQVYFPVLREIGDRWARGEINVAQEHYASTLIRDQLVGTLVAVGARNAGNPHAVCTTYPGELHELGALALGVQLGLSGYRVSYLGANMPLPDLADFVHKQDPVIVVVSAITPVARGALIEYATTLRQSASARTRIVLGGRGFELTPPPSIPGVELIPEWGKFDPRAPALEVRALHS
jgi:DNA-binding transcriptional MerR regulator